MKHNAHLDNLSHTCAVEVIGAFNDGYSNRELAATRKPRLATTTTMQFSARTALLKSGYEVLDVFKNPSTGSKITLWYHPGAGRKRAGGQVQSVKDIVYQARVWLADKINPVKNTD